MFTSLFLNPLRKNACNRKVWVDEEFLGLLSWRRKLSSVLSCSHSQKSFLGEIFAVMISLFLRVRKFRDEHYVCCFTLYGGEWCGLEAGRGDATTKRLQDFKLRMIFSACFFFLGFDFDFQHCVVGGFSFSWVSYSAFWEEFSERLVILGCLHQISLCWRQQFRMSRDLAIH